jgi:hypothetical protein
MAEIDHEALKRQLSHKVSAWFARLIQQLAIKHDINGPQILLVSFKKYTSRLKEEIAAAAAIARANQGLDFPPQHLDDYCQLAAEDVVRIRQIQCAYLGGYLSNEELKQTSYYAPFRVYFDQYAQILTEGFESPEDESCPPWQAAEGAVQSPGEISDNAHLELLPEITALSEQAQEWLDLHIQNLLLAEDLRKPAHLDLNEKAYIFITAPLSRGAITRAVHYGELDLGLENIPVLCRMVAAEAFAVRQLRKQLASNAAPTQQLKQTPLYLRFCDYLEQAPELQELAAEALSLHALRNEYRKSQKN